MKLDKSGGCVDRDDEYMQQSREASIKEYFFGDPRRTLSPHTQQVDFDALTVYKVREGEHPISGLQISKLRISDDEY